MESSNIAERLANLSSAKRALLEQRLKEESRASLVVQSIPRRASREFAPLSFAQQRLWFLNRLDPESFVYNEARAVRLTGVLDVTALEKSLNYLIARHEVLRTVIVLDEGSPVQRVTDDRNIELPVIDLRGRHATEREAESRRLINETVQRPFVLSRDPTLRVLLLRLEAEQYVFVVVKHHIASDAWSSRIFW